MKYLIKKIANTKFSILLRNSFKIRPAFFYANKNLNNATISDCFCWRTDDGFATKFKFSDIYNLFFEMKDSWVEIIFFDKNDNLIKKVKINRLNISNEIIIDSNFFNGLKDYGTFYIYHFSKDKKKLANETLINRCYAGYSKQNNFFSFVHGNTLSRYKKIDNEKKELSDIVTTSYFQNHIYKIQKNFEDFDKSELVFSNPTQKKIRFKIDKDNYILNGGCSKKITFSRRKEILIITDCLWLRPLVFSYKEKYFDVHHS